MKKVLNSLKLILSWNTLIVTILAIIATYFCLQEKWIVDFPLTIVGIAVVFPIVFSIGGAYSRRENALGQYANIKGMGRAIYLAARDWVHSEKDTSKLENLDKIRTTLS